MQNNNYEDVSKITEELWLRLRESGLPIHSFLAEQGGRLLKEAYQAPYGATDLHRMFSITKSFCSLATGFLSADGLLSLDDRITDHFPEYISCREVHPWLKEMTIRHMLTMETCHSATTYKADPGKNWVESFFTTPPSHRSGQIFHYDTSSSHTLAALVKKLTGKGVLDYLREKCLNRTDFSKEAYIIPDPFGWEMGGSGLMARPTDLMKLGRYCMDTIRNGEGKFADYLREAVSFQVPTIHFGQTLDEQQGYGYQFWRICGGFAMYGMGGQYVLFYPDPDLIFVVTADTQNIKGGNQKILDLIHDGVKKTGGFKEQPPVLPCLTSWDALYRLSPNPAGFSSLSLSFGSGEGAMTLQGRDRVFRFPFSFDFPLVSVLAGYDQRIALQAMWAGSDSLYLPVQIAGECVGSLHFLLKLSGEKITLGMKKIEETRFQEFQGFLEGET
ncbi:serine hydrolase domain-containing protein [Lachnospiraceae bacterium 54-53]